METSLSSVPAFTQLAERLVVPKRLCDLVRETFGLDFHWFDHLGEQCRVGDSPLVDDGSLSEILRAVASGDVAEIILETDSLATLAIPLACEAGSWVAVASFLTRQLGAPDLRDLADEMHYDWLARQQPWPIHALERLSATVVRRNEERTQSTQLQRELDQVSQRLGESYEEISLLHGISQNFRLSSSDEELGVMALEWLSDCLLAEGLALLYLPVAREGECTYAARTELKLLKIGKSGPATAEEAMQLVEQCGIVEESRPVVINRNRSPLAAKLPESLQQLVIVPMLDGDRMLGYLFAVNHDRGEEFGSVEAKLLASVGAILSVHCSNRDLYRQQAELLASVVRALTSAIDAKDPYTCGHSDRVARVSTRIAQELGCEKDFLATIYMAGLLHDIGKIGVDDAVLRKPGRLTEGEFAHVKQHPGLGYKILADIKPLADVLPAVLHHHEQWDGHGYPCELGGEQIPFMARVVAVADAYDAMTSDRPYRPGMPEEKVMKIFSEGAGKQWDPEVIAAFLRALDDIRSIVSQDRADLSLDVQQWLI